MLLAWKKFLLKVIIIAVHALILAVLFFPGVRKFFSFTWIKSPAPPEVQPVPTYPETMPELPDQPAENPTKPAENQPKPAEPTKPQPTKPAEPTKPQPTKPATGKLANIAPYRQGHYKLDLKKLPEKLTKNIDFVRSGVLIDLDTHTILWERNSTKQYPIASLTKMLTSLALLRRVETSPDITLQTTVKVTKEDFEYIKSKKMGNGALLEPTDVFTLQDYLKCMVISSCNDAAYIIGKYLGDGDLATGIQRLNAQAKALGLADVTIHTPNGLPYSQEPRVENQGSAISVAFLGECVMKSPEYMKWAGTTKDSIVHHRGNHTDLAATNRLLRDRVPGITGLKTGYTDGAGQCIALSCTREKRTLLLVVMGVPANGDHGKRRDEAAKQLLDWGFQQLAK